MTDDDPKPAISVEEMHRRHEHVRAAIADNRLEGIATDDATLELCEAYIRGEIEAADLLTAYRKRVKHGGADR
jgi:hypothetical protein